MTYAINHKPRSGSASEGSFVFDHVRAAQDDLLPIIDPRQNDKALSDAASIHKDCGLDNICIPDLKIAYNVSSGDQYLIGSDQKLEVSMNITNEGEDAYEAALYVQLPPHVSYKTEMISNGGPELNSVLCSPPTFENDFMLKCDLGNPMLGFSMISLRTIVKPIMKDGNALPIAITMRVNSSNPELTTSLDDNDVKLDIPVIVETDMIIRGLPDPDPLRHNSSAYSSELENILHESEIGPELTHIYQVENKGPSDIIEAEVRNNLILNFSLVIVFFSNQVYILWPSFRPNGDPLLYLTSQPTIDGMGTCDFVTDVNPYQVEVNQFKPFCKNKSGLTFGF